MDHAGEDFQESNVELIEVPDGASTIMLPRLKTSKEFVSTENETLLSSSNPLNWKSLLTQRLAHSHTAVLTIYTIITAFVSYFSIYGISASLFAATFDGVKLGSLELKVAFSISQLIGYALSKIAGAFIIPTIKRHQRWRILLLLITLGVLPLILFGVLPPAGQVVMVFLSGLPVAWIWGVMVMYLEGRRTSEFLLMGLYLSVMVASGSAKSIATAVLQAGLSESWMPAACGCCSALVFMTFVTLLDAIPDPSTADKLTRKERRTISPQATRKFLIRWAPGLIILTLVYSLLTAFRNFRDFFAPELWRDLEGAGFNPSMFTQSELPVGICTAVAYSLLYWLKDDKRAFFAILGVMFLGGAVVLAATILKVAGLVHPLAWMIMVGVGLYMAYIPPGAMLYDRFNGATGHPYTSVFMIYLSDVCGYSVSLGILLYRNFGDANIRYVDFFYTLSYLISFGCMAGMVLAGIYFAFSMRNLRKGDGAQPLAQSGESTHSGQEEEGTVCLKMEDFPVPDMEDDDDNAAQPASA